MSVVRRSGAGGGLFVPNGLFSRWVGDNTLCLAILSDPAFGDLFDERDVDLVGPAIPWSRNIARCPDEVVERIRHAPARYVLKRPLDACGRGVLSRKDSVRCQTPRVDGKGRLDTHGHAPEPPRGEAPRSDGPTGPPRPGHGREHARTIQPTAYASGRHLSRDRPSASTGRSGSGPAPARAGPGSGLTPVTGTGIRLYWAEDPGYPPWRKSAIAGLDMEEVRGVASFS